MRKKRSQWSQGNKSARKQRSKEASAEKQAIRLWRMPLFLEHPRNGKEIKDFCHFGSRKETRSQGSKVARKQGRKGIECRVKKVQNIVS
jgi:hypothetical protein